MAEPRGSPIFTPSIDDPYMLEPQSFFPTSTPPSPEYTPATPHTNDESEPFETSKTRVTSPPSPTLPADPTSPPYPQRPLLAHTSPTPTLPRPFYYRCIARMVVRTKPTLSPGYSAKLTKAMALSPSSFRKRYKSSYKTPSSSSLASSSTLPLRKRYKGTYELMEDKETESTESGDEGTDLEDEETAPEGQQQAARHHALKRARDTVPSTYEVGQGSESTPDQQLETAGEIPTQTHARLLIHITWEDSYDGTIYRDIECNLPPVRSPIRASPAPVRTPSSSFRTTASPEWSLESLSVSQVIPSPIASLAPAAALDEDVLLEIGVQLKLYGSVLHTHSELLDTLPPSRFEGYDHDFTKLFSMTEAVREEIYTQHCRLRGLK
ncbi:hypothetical protein Tco_0522769 [Tanacetum coccineum]